MPKQNVDYSRTVIYKIVCNDLTITDLYVGSTTDFTRRKTHHKSASKTKGLKIYTAIRDKGGFDNWSMIEIEKFPCADGNEARSRERYWYETLNATLNMNRPIVLNTEIIAEKIEYNKEYSASHSSEKKEYNKEYNAAHTDESKAYQQLYYQKNKDEIKQRLLNKNI